MTGDTACALLMSSCLVGLAGVELHNLYRRHQAEEARENLDILFLATTAYVSRAQARGDAIVCPHLPGETRGSTEFTPPLAVACWQAKDGLCTPNTTPELPGQYDPAVFDDDPIWQALEYRKQQGHRFHFHFQSKSLAGTCTFSVTALADLDGDGDFSRFVRHGIVDEKGARPLGPLESHAPYE
ncbi:MAG: hypothetical protein ACPG77_08020 [Nannocystaceae bacterium]